jgi:hypothetical protein
MNDQPGRLRLFDLDSQSAHCIYRVHAIFAWQKSTQCAYAIGESRDDHRPVRNALITRHSDFEIDSRRPFYPQIHRMNLNVPDVRAGCSHKKPVLR